MQLRYYQQEAIDSVFNYFAKEGLPANASPVIQLPTGSGKSLVIAALVRKLVEEYGCRIVMATHRAELIEQNAHDLKKFWPEANIGIYSAGLNQKEANKPIVYAGIQSAFRNFTQFGFVDIVIVDEAHMISTEESTSYRKFIDGLKLLSPDLRLIGLTATPYRQGQGLITNGKDALFTSICYKINEAKLIEDGFLSPLVSESKDLVDCDSLKKTTADFVLGDLDLAFNIEHITTKVVDDIVKHFANGRRCGLIYGTSIAHAQNLCDAVKNRGLTCAVVTGDTDRTERVRIYDAFKAGELQLLSSCDVLTTGFNVPQVDLIAFVRATISTALYVQILGRGMRIAPSKENCCVLDYGGNIARHGPIDQIKIKDKVKRQGGEAPTKVCPECGAENFTMARSCSHCDFEFPAPEKKANAFASKLQPISSNGPRHTIAEPELRFTVKKIMLFRHANKQKNTTTVRVDYFADAECFEKIVSQWLCPEHTGFARRSFEHWWRVNVNTPIPDTVDEVIERQNEIPKVVQVITKENEKTGYNEVVRIVVQHRQPGDEDESPYIGYNSDNFLDDDLPF